VVTSLVVAASQNDVIGRGKELPWYLPGDLRQFKRLTLGHTVVMGRVTHESILTRLGHQLVERRSIVISSSRREAKDDSVIWASSINAAITMAQELESPHAASEFFIIGGASVYRQSLPYVEKIYLTRVHSEVPGDSHLPAGWLEGFKLIGRDNQHEPEPEYPYSFLEYVREL
jgi:dihydrofolate reductase